MRCGLWCVGAGIWVVCAAASAAEAVATSADADLQQVVVTGHLEEDLPLEALADADEAFLSGTTRDVQPIRSVDGKALPAAPGPVTRKAAEIFKLRAAEQVDP